MMNIRAITDRSRPPTGGTIRRMGASSKLLTKFDSLVSFFTKINWFYTSILIFSFVANVFTILIFLSQIIIYISLLGSVRNFVRLGKRWIWEEEWEENSYEKERERKWWDFAALFIIARTWKQLRCPSADEWIRSSGTYTQWSIIQPLKRIHLNQFYEVDETGVYYIEWSKPETPIQYTNTYIWNLERW